MKYILIFLFALLCSVGYAQYPVNQTLGAPTTLVTSRGGLRADSSLILPQFPDTAAANRSPYIKFYPGNMIRVYNDIYMRNTTATKWQLVNPSGGGTNNAIDSLRIINDSVYARKYGVFIYQYKTPTTDTTSLSNRINQKLNISDTAAMLAPYSTRINSKIDSLYKIGDSVFARKNGVFIFQYLDVSQNILVNNGLSFSGDTIQLGGRLSKNTNINQANNDFTFDSTKNFTVIDVNGWDRVGVNQTQSFLNKGGIGGASTVLVDNQKAKLSSTDGVDKTSQINVYADSVEVYPNEGKLYTNVPSNVDTIGFYPLKINSVTGKVEAYAGGFAPSIDTNTLRRVKYVGLTMPTAFNVTGSPITDSGTIAVTGAGTASQYVRGDGVLGDFPTATTGGGASVSYYLNGSVNKGTFVGNTYYEMSRTAIIGAGTDFTRTNVQGDGYIAQFITDTITNLLIPAGNWNLEFYFSASSGGGTPSYYVELYKYDGTNFTLISSNSTSPELIAFGTTINPYFSALAVPETILSGTDRLALRIYVNTSGRSITLHTENSHLCQVITTFTTGLTAINGLTKQVQYLAVGTSGTDFNISSSNDTHTFNLPTASATNRGALSSADWTTFNGKLNPSDTTSLSNRINTKLNISDTSSMLSPYLRSIDTTNRFVTSVFRKTASDSVFFVRGGSNNFAFRDSAGGANIYNTDGTLTGNRTVTMGSNTLNFTRDLTINGIRVGRGNFIASSNTALGQNAMFSNVSGVESTGIGSEALRSLTSGNSNTAVGQEALFTLSTGTGNTAVGRWALRSYTASGATAIGHRAGTNATSSGVYIGQFAGENATGGGLYIGNSVGANTTGSQNVQIGSGNITSGTLNTLIAGGGITTGSENVCIGSSSMGGNGNQNVSIGVYANERAGTRNANTIIGYQSLKELTTGSNNVSLGFQAGYGTATAGVFDTLASNSIFVGYRAYPKSFNETNQIVIGYDERGLGSNTTIIGNSSTTTTAIRGSLLLGTTTDNSSAILNATSTTKGFLQPRLTTTQMNAISTPATGLSVFNTTDSSNYVYRGTGGGWSALVNATGNQTIGGFKTFSTVLTTTGLVGTVANFTGNAAFGITQIGIGGSGGFGGGTNYWVGTSAPHLTLNSNNPNGGIQFNGNTVIGFSYGGNSSAFSNITPVQSFTTGLTAYHNQFKATLNATGNAFANTLYNRGFFVESGTLTPNSTTLIPIGFENQSGTNLLNSTSGSTLIGGQFGTLVGSAKLQVESTTQGFMPPRMTTSQRDLIASPAAGLIIYNTTTNKHQGYNGTTWNDFY